MQEQDDPSIFEDELSLGLQQAVYAISKWSRLLSVIGFAIGAFVVTLMLFSGATIINAFQSFFGGNVQGLYGALIVVFFIFFFIAAAVLYFLYKAAALLHQGAQQSDTTLIAEGFNFLKKFFIVLAIVSTLTLIGKLVSLFNYAR